MRIDSLYFSYRSAQRTTPIFSDLTRSFSANAVHAVIGRSGCGKTTLLYLLAGLLEPDDGSVDLGSVQRPAIILQDYGLFPWKRVRENIALGLKLRKESPVLIHDRCSSVMEELGIAHIADAYPSAISGGERQRVAIARALVLDPKVLLMDEPFSSLDAMNREKMQDLLLNIHAQHQMTVLLVTHSIEEAAFVSSGIHVMKRGQHADFLPEIESTAGGLSRRSRQFHDTVDAVRSLLEEA
jgi:NitT/TauT family transport system ATP-binding protein